MSKARLLFFLIFGLLIGVILTVATYTSAQEEQTPKTNWAHLKIVTYASGLTGFFDPDTGKIYVYASDLENCFIIRQLVELGKPLKKITLIEQGREATPNGSPRHLSNEPKNRD